MLSPSRFNLEGVSPVGFWGQPQKLDPRPRCPEDIPIPSVLRAVMEFRGEGLGCQQAGLPGWTGAGNLACAYAYMLGVSGAAFYTCWDDRWMDDCISIAWLGSDFQTAEKRILASLGYSFRWIERQEGLDCRDEWLDLIFASLYERRMPVLSYGIIGPPEPSIITGWDAGGEILMGWSYWQDSPFFPNPEFEPGGQFRKRNWLDGNGWLLEIGEGRPRPDLQEVYRTALEWAVQVVHVPKVFPALDAPDWVASKWNGLAALNAWEAALLDDAAFPEDQSTLQQRHAMIFGVAGNLAEERSMADVFLQQVAARLPAIAPELIGAGALYQDEHELFFKMGDFCHGMDRPEDCEKLADRGVRQGLASVVAAMRAKEEAAVGLLEKAIANWPGLAPS